MPIRYEIHPELDFLLYVFEGNCTAEEYFELYHSIYLKDGRRHHGMKILVDIFNGTLDFDVNSMRTAKAIVAENKEKGHPRDRVAFLTRSSVLKNVQDAFLLLMGDLPMELEIFHNFQDAAQWLGFTGREQDAFLFWKQVSTR